MEDGLCGASRGQHINEFLAVKFYYPSNIRSCRLRSVKFNNNEEPAARCIGFTADCRAAVQDSDILI